MSRRHLFELFTQAAWSGDCSPNGQTNHFSAGTPAAGRTTFEKLL